MPTVYPCVPGHEIVGRVTKVGSAVKKFKPGDLAAVGCMVDSDGTCPNCRDGLEQFCPHLILTYNFPDKQAHVVVFTTSPGKKEDARPLGADEVVVSRNADEMQKHAGSFDFILDAVAANHDINAYISLLRRDGNITLVGAPEKPLDVAAFGLIMGRRSLSGCAIGGIAETQEMLDFCGKHEITSDVEIIPIQKVNEAYERLLKSDVKYRFSIDMASLKSE
jgi:D-arabinose 1-dehydrogenase-like Zn-dependent alcohol dehydrogenase